MGDIGDYWRDHKEYQARKKRGKQSPPEVEYECSCGKKYYSVLDGHRIRDHMKRKGEHRLIKGELSHLSKINGLQG